MIKVVEILNAKFPGQDSSDYPETIYKQKKFSESDERIRVPFLYKFRAKKIIFRRMKSEIRRKREVLEWSEKRSFF